MTTLQSAHQHYGAAMELFRDRAPAQAIQRMQEARTAFSDPALTRSTHRGVAAYAYLGQTLSSAALGDYGAANHAVRAMVQHATMGDAAFLVGELDHGARAHNAVGHTHRAAYLHQISTQLTQVLHPEAAAPAAAAAVPRGWPKEHVRKTEFGGGHAHAHKPAILRPVQRPERLTPGD